MKYYALKFKAKSNRGKPKLVGVYSSKRSAFSSRSRRYNKGEKGRIIVFTGKGKIVR